MTRNQAMARLPERLRECVHGLPCQELFDTADEGEIEERWAMARPGRPVSNDLAAAIERAERAESLLREVMDGHLSSCGWGEEDCDLGDRIRALLDGK